MGTDYNTLLLALAFACRTDPDETEMSRITIDFGKMNAALSAASGMQKKEDVVDRILKRMGQEDWSTVNAPK